MSGNVTLVSTDPQEVVDKVLQSSVKLEEPTFGEVAENSDETSSESQAEQAESQQEADQRPNRRKSKQKRLAEKLTDTERERDEFRQRLERLERAQSGSGAGENKPQQAASETPDPNAYPVQKPKAEDFEKPQDFIEKLADWKADERDWKKERAEQVQAQQKVVSDYFERVDEAREKHEDFDDVISEAGDVRFRDDGARNAFYAAIYENEDGPDVLYHIAKHPELAESFAEMTPGQVAAKIGRIASSMNSPEPQKPAPRLINPVGGGSKRADAPSDTSDIPHSKWKELRKAGKIR